MTYLLSRLNNIALNIVSFPPYFYVILIINNIQHYNQNAVDKFENLFLNGFGFTTMDLACILSFSFGGIKII